MGFGIGFFHIVHIIGGNQFQIMFFGKFNEHPVCLTLLFHAVIHDLDKEVLSAENIQILLQRLLRALEVAHQRRLGTDDLFGLLKGNQHIFLIRRFGFVIVRFVIPCPPQKHTGDLAADTG